MLIISLKSLEDFLGIPENSQKDGTAVGGLAPRTEEEALCVVSAALLRIHPSCQQIGSCGSRAASWPAEPGRNWRTADVDKGDEWFKGTGSLQNDSGHFIQAAFGQHSSVHGPSWDPAQERGHGTSAIHDILRMS